MHVPAKETSGGPRAFVGKGGRGAPAMPVPIDIEDLLVWAYRDEKVETNPSANRDALNVHWAVLALPPSYAEVIRHYARSGEPPTWRPNSGPVIVLEEARRARALHGEWLRCLAVLRRALDGALLRFEVSGPAAGAGAWRRMA
jgi:hypothetical protein